jgi:glutamate N-acetyltransferase/amino-acid N-acetyltransferase
MPCVVSWHKTCVRDGEGATKFITLNVKGCETDESARHIAHAIATSALVKTAFFWRGCQWGRIIAAAGRGRRALLS